MALTMPPGKEPTGRNSWPPSANDSLPRVELCMALTIPPGKEPSSGGCKPSIGTPCIGIACGGTGDCDSWCGNVECGCPLAPLCGWFSTCGGIMHGANYPTRKRTTHRGPLRVIFFCSIQGLNIGPCGWWMKIWFAHMWFACHNSWHLPSWYRS